MFDLNWQPILWAMVVPIQIKHVQCSVSYQQATDRHGHESPSGYGLLGFSHVVGGVQKGQEQTRLERFYTVWMGHNKFQTHDFPIL